ncbi:cell division protein FtsZ [Candidatus Hydrogenedentota bacterium]
MAKQPVQKDTSAPATIIVAGVGGAGGNAVNNMVEAEVKGVHFIAINTDAQALRKSRAHKKIQIGTSLTRGLGAGADPVRGREAAREQISRIERALEGANMVFITAGLGGGTGTGAAPIVAEVARKKGALTVAIVTTPMRSEGAVRRQTTGKGMKRLRPLVDTMIVVSNERLLQQSGTDTKLLDAFIEADDILRQGVQGIADLITMPGMINLDFADVRTIMQNAGKALMGIGQAEGEGRALVAAKKALTSSLIKDSDIAGATRILVNITGGRDLTLFEVNQATRLVQGLADSSANIIFGTVVGREKLAEVTVTVIAAGFDVTRKESSHKARRTKKDLLTPEELDVPAFQRRQTNSEREQVDILEEDLDVPTFIRRKREEDADGG